MFLLSRVVQLIENFRFEYEFCRARSGTSRLRRRIRSFKKRTSVVSQSPQHDELTVNMASKVRRIRETLPFMYGLDLIDELEFCILYDAAGKRNHVFPYKHYVRLNLENISNDERKAEFRFDLEDLPILAQAMRIPEKFTCDNGILLKRFAYPCHYSDMISRFGRSVPELSEIANTVVEFVYSTHGHLLQTMNQRWLQPHRLQDYANAVHACGAALENCWGFVDGTVGPIKAQFD